MHIKDEGMTQIAFSELYSNQPKSEIYPKMPMFELKTIFDPSLERSWYELFGIIKAYGPKNQTPSSARV